MISAYMQRISNNKVNLSTVDRYKYDIVSVKAIQVLVYITLQTTSISSASPGWIGPLPGGLTNYCPSVL